MKKIILFIIFIVCTTTLWAGDIEINQIDTNSLLFRGEIDIYFSLPGEKRHGFSAEDFNIQEKDAGKLEITNLLEEPNKDTGINFILLIDNSGSMYEESYNGNRRIDQARTALEFFLDQIDESRDQAALFAFNTNLMELAPLGTSIPDIRRSISMLEQPDAAGSYTELYNSLIDLGSVFPKESGRKALIVLSDGENYPLFRHGEIESSQWETTLAQPEDIIQSSHKAGITIDGINISDEMDLSLEKICDESGGKFHDVRSTEAISDVYSKIRDRITNEYMMTVKIPPLKNSIGMIEISFEGKSDSRILPAPVLFGSTANTPALLNLLLLFIGIGTLVILFFIPFEKPVKSAQIQSLESGQKTILSSDATIIGASRDADFTIAGQPGIDAEHATIVQDEKTGNYTLVSNKTVRVNNRKVKTRNLSPGDVIRIEGSTIIFDAPDSTKIN